MRRQQAQALEQVPEQEPVRAQQQVPEQVRVRVPRLLEREQVRELVLEQEQRTKRQQRQSPCPRQPCHPHSRESR